MRNVCLIFFGLMLCCSVFAQINLDKPLSAGRSDKLFASTIDSGIAYYLPVALIRNNEAILNDRDKFSATAMFNVSLSEQDLDRTTKALLQSGESKMKIKLFRPLSYEVFPGVDIPPSYEPQVKILNDFNFDGSTQISIIVDSWHRLFGRRSAGMSFLDSMLGRGSADNVAIISYEMNAQVQGVPARMKTSVSVFAGERLGREELYEENFMQDIINDAETPCWDHVRVGQICYKK